MYITIFQLNKNNDNVFIKNSIYANTVNNINNVRSREYGKKGLENFTDKVAKDLIKKQSIRDEQRKIREEYLENKYKEASDLTNDIEVYIESLNNIININPNVISIEEFIKRDIQDVPKELLVPYTKPIELSLRKPTLLEKISKKSKQKYNLYIQQENEKYEKEYKLYEENENNRKNKIKAHNLQVEEIIKTKKELYKIKMQHL